MVVQPTAAHVVPGQGVAHPPQFCASVSVSTQAPSQAVSVCGTQGLMHAPPEQIFPSGALARAAALGAGLAAAAVLGGHPAGECS